MSKKLFSWSKALPMLGIGLLVAGVLAFTGGSSTSAHGNWHDSSTKYLLTLTGVPGDAANNAIQLDSYRFLEDEPEAATTAETAAAAEADFGDNNLRFLADASSASPLLFAKATTGEHIAEGTLAVRKGKSSTDYLVYKMTDIVISSYQSYGNQDNDPLDEVVLSYATLEITHNDSTPMKKGWNFKDDVAL